MIFDHTGGFMDEWLTYKQSGERLGISPEAARQRAIRGHWPRRMTNEGTALVRVPEDANARTNARRTPEQTPVEHPHANMTVRVAELQVQVDMLQQMLADMRGERDRWQQVADQLLQQSARQAPVTGVSDIVQRMRERHASKAA